MNSRWYTRWRRRRQNIQRWILTTPMTWQWDDDDDGGASVDDEVKDEETKHFQKMVFANGLHTVEANCLHTVHFPRNANVNAYGATHTHTQCAGCRSTSHLGSWISFLLRCVYAHTIFIYANIPWEYLLFHHIRKMCVCSSRAAFPPLPHILWALRSHTSYHYQNNNNNNQDTGKCSQIDVKDPLTPPTLPSAPPPISMRHSECFRRSSVLRQA